jgi:hypothetical protein
MEPLPIRIVPALNTLWRGAARLSMTLPYGHYGVWQGGSAKPNA